MFLLAAKFSLAGDGLVSAFYGPNLADSGSAWIPASLVAEVLGSKWWAFAAILPIASFIDLIFAVSTIKM
jgi:hypothetical protein